MPVQRLYRKTRDEGVRAVLEAVYRRAVPPRAVCAPLLTAATRDRIGLEVGGPSPIFSRRGQLPVYPSAKRIDGCNFATDTVWEGQIAEGWTYVCDPRTPAGQQFICEANQLDPIDSERYDFLLTSHCLEHLADPLRGLNEWRRVLKPEGVLAMVVPHRDATFDRRRPITTLAHLEDDFRNSTPESDLTHLDESIQLHDFALSPQITDPAAFAERSRHNLVNRCLHHHVFDTALATTLIDRLGLQILAVEPMLPCHVIVLARKLRDGDAADNATFLSPEASWRRRSPFASDRLDATTPR